MRQIERMAGATLIFGNDAEPPQPVDALQYLLEDIRAGALGTQSAREISGLRMSGGHIRLRAAEYDLAIALSGEGLPLSAFSGAVRPARAEQADLQRGRILHLLRRHRCALGLLLRVRAPRDPAQPSPADGLLALALPLCMGLKPRLVMLQGSGLLLTLDEFACLRTQGLPPGPGQTVPLALAPRTANRARLMLGEGAHRAAPAAVMHGPARPQAVPLRTGRENRRAAMSLGRIFGTTRQTAPLQNLPASELRLARAMRRAQPLPRPAARRWRATAEAAILALWFALVLPPTPL